MPNIHTLTLNPVVDLIYRMDTFEKGGAVRSREFQCVPAGKGLNVSAVLAALGAPSTAYLLLGEDDEALYQAYCKQTNIEWKAVTGGFSVRRHCTLLEDNGGVTHIQTHGDPIKTEWAEELVDQLVSNISTDDFVVMSGSLPPGIDSGFYADVIERCRMSGALVLLDASGPALLKGARARPYAIKINQHEAQELLGRAIEAPQEEFAALQAVHQQSDIPLSIITMGARGMIAGCEEGVWRMSVKMDAGEVKDSVGCGDALAAGLVYGLVNQLPLEDGFKSAIAAASAAVTLVGPGRLDRKTLDAMIDRVKSQKIGEL